jgi:hypothetical protein
MRSLVWALSAMLLVGSRGALGADKDDFYAEAVANFSLNHKSRTLFGARVGYVFRDDLGLGAIYEQHSSKNANTADSSFYRSGLEFRWFQEPFEFAASLGIGQRYYRDKPSSVQVVPAVSAAYLWALTPSLAVQADFNFFFLNELRVLFTGGLGARILF